MLTKEEVLALPLDEELPAKILANTVAPSYFGDDEPLELEEKILRLITVLLVDWFPASDRKVESIIALLTMVQVRAKDRGCSSPFDLLLTNIATGLMYAPPEQAAGFGCEASDPSGWGWVPSPYRRLSDSAIPRDCGGLGPEEDRSMALYEEIRFEGLEDRRRAVLALKRRLFSLGVTLPMKPDPDFNDIELEERLCRQAGKASAPALSEEPPREDAGRARSAKKLRLMLGQVGETAVSPRCEAMARECGQGWSLGSGEGDLLAAAVATGHACDLPAPWVARYGEYASLGLEKTSLATVCAIECISGGAYGLSLLVEMRRSLREAARLVRGMVEEGRALSVRTLQGKLGWNSRIGVYSEVQLQTLLNLLCLTLGEYANACLRLAPGEEMEDASAAILRGRDPSRHLWEYLELAGNQRFQEMVATPFMLIHDYV